jgi:hypothetical protein
MEASPPPNGRRNASFTDKYPLKMSEVVESARMRNVLQREGMDGKV